MIYHNFIINSLNSRDWNVFKLCKDKALEMERESRNEIVRYIRTFLSEEYEDYNFKFKEIFTVFLDKDSNDLSKDIKKDFEEYINSPKQMANNVNDSKHDKTRYTNKFITGTESVRECRVYYAIIITLCAIISLKQKDKKNNLINVTEMYRKLFDQLDISAGYRENLIITRTGEEGNIWANESFNLMIMIYMAVLFENKTNKDFTIYKSICKKNLQRAINKGFETIDHRQINKAELEKILISIRKKYAGKLLHRGTIENMLGGVGELLICEGNRMVNTATFAMYTGSSFLNIAAAEIGVVDRNLVTIEPKILEFLDSEGQLNLILTDPFSMSADEAVFSDKMGNRNSNVTGTNTPFSSSYDIIKNLENKENLSIKYTNISLPYSIMKMEFIAGFSKYNYIKIDLYSCGICSNSDRLSTIVFKEDDRGIYESLDKTLGYISGESYEIDTSYNPHIKIIKKDEYERKNEKTRVYFTGQKEFAEEKNSLVKNALSNIEFGTSLYPEPCVDAPHYHRLTNEHYMIVKGQQKILDIRNQEEFVANEGDVVFIPKLTPHITKEITGTKIVFAKSPLGMDKEDVKLTEDIEIWKKKK